MFVQVRAKNLLFVCVVLIATVTNALADYKKDIQDKFASWVSGDARYFVSLEGRHFLLGSESAWRKENDKIVDILLENGYLDSYRDMKEDCSSTNVIRPDCKYKTGTLLFRPTAKMTRLFPAEYLFEIIKGEHSGIYFVMGKIDYINVIDIILSDENDCDYVALVRKGISEKTEVGNLIADFEEYSESYCFKETDGGIELVKYRPEY